MKAVLVQREQTPKLGPGPHPLAEPAEPEELVGRVELLVGGREGEKQRLQAQDVLEERRRGQRPTIRTSNVSSSGYTVASAFVAAWTDGWSAAIA